MPSEENDLQDAILGGDLKRCQTLLDEGASLSSPCKGGHLPLALAMFDKQLEIAALFLKAGADPDCPVYLFETPLLTDLLTSSRDGDRIRFLLKAGASPLAANCYGQTCFYWAMAVPTAAFVNLEHGSFEVVQMMLEYGLSPLAADQDGMTLLHLATSVRAKIGNSNLFAPEEYPLAAICELLMAKGADPDARDLAGWTPLHHAARWGRPDIVSLLLDRGADLNARTGTGETAEELLRQQFSLKYERIRSLLTAAGNRPSPPVEAALAPARRSKQPVSRADTENGRALIKALEKDDTETLQKLLQQGLSPDFRTGDLFRTGLHVAVDTGHAGAVRLLLAAGACPDPRDVRAQTETLNGLKRRQIFPDQERGAP